MLQMIDSRKIYAGIGSRETPIEIQHIMTLTAQHLQREGWMLRSGHARGADRAFERPVLEANREIYTTQSFGKNGCASFADCWQVAKPFHTNPERLDDYSKRLHARNAMQILGASLQSPVQLVICWTKDGKPSGGTSTAIHIAQAHRIPVLNLAVEIDRQKVLLKIGRPDLEGTIKPRPYSSKVDVEFHRLTRLGYLDAYRRLPGDIDQDWIIITHCGAHLDAKMSADASQIFSLPRQFKSSGGDDIKAGSIFTGSDGEKVRLVEVNGEKFKSPAFFWIYEPARYPGLDAPYGEDDHILMAMKREALRKDGESWFWAGDEAVHQEYEWRLADDLQLSQEEDVGDPGFTEERMYRNMSQSVRISYESDAYEVYGGQAYEKHDDISIRSNPIHVTESGIELNDPLTAVARYVQTRTPIKRCDDAYRVAGWLIDVVGNDETEINRWISYLRGEGLMDDGRRWTPRLACKWLKYLSEELTTVEPCPEDVSHAALADLIDCRGTDADYHLYLRQVAEDFGITYQMLLNPPAQKPATKAEFMDGLDWVRLAAMDEYGLAAVEDAYHELGDDEDEPRPVRESQPQYSYHKVATNGRNRFSREQAFEMIRKAWLV